MTIQNMAIIVLMLMFHVRTAKQFSTTCYIHLYVNDFVECLYSIYMPFTKEHYPTWQLQMISLVCILYKPVVAVDLASYQDKQNNH
jgi:hypothetical protein